MKLLLPLFAGCFAFSSPLLTAQVAVAPGQGINFSSFGDGTFTDLEFGSPVILSQVQPLDSFTKFDPSLGTLQEVRLTAEIRTDISVLVESSAIIDEFSLFSLF